MSKFIIYKKVDNRFTYWMQTFGYDYIWNGCLFNATEFGESECRSVLKQLIAENNNEVYYKQEIKG